MARFILDKTEVLKRYKELETVADLVSYSLKSNYEVGEMLESGTDCAFSVHTLPSLKRLTDKKRAWFFCQATTIEEFSALNELGVHKFVVDNEADLATLLEYVGEKKIELLLRMKLKENTVHTGKHFVFGMRASKINELIPQLKKNTNIERIGVHFHRKTQNVSEWSLKYELEQSLDAETLDAIDFVNIGGGLPSRYKNFRVEVYDNIFKKIKELKEWLNSLDIKMIIEPGRYIAAPSIKLEAEIKSMYDNNIIIDCSIFNSAMDTFVAHIRLLVENELESGDAYTIKGCTPDSMDIFRYKVFLDKPKVGDKITFLNAGAYNFSTDFCSLPKLETVNQ